MNDHGVSTLFERRVCIDCGQPYTISGRELAWLESRGLQPFRRCSVCRAERRQAQAGHNPGGPAGRSTAFNQARVTR